MTKNAAIVDGGPASLGMFRRVLIASIGSTMGDGIVFVALPLLASDLTSEAWKIAGVLAAERLAWLFSLVTGAFADRFSRVATMVVADLLRMILLAIVTVVVLTDHLNTVWPLYIVAFIMGLATSAFYASSHSLITELASAEDLVSRLSRMMSAQVVSELFVGRSSGSALYEVRRALPFGVDALTFGFSAAWLSTLRDPRRREHRPPRPPHWLRGDIREALRFVRNDRFLRAMTMFIAVMALTQAMFTAILVPFARDELQLDSKWVGAFIALPSIGDLLGAHFAPRIRNTLAMGRYLPIAVGVSAVAIAVSGIVPNVWLVMMALSFEAFAVTSANVITQASRQKAMPDAHRATLVNFIRMTVFAGVPVGALLGGVIGDTSGLRWSFVAAALLQAAALPFVVKAFWTRRDPTSPDVGGVADVPA